MRSLSLVIPIVLALSAWVNAQTGVPDPAAAEFPQYDAQLLWAQQRGAGLAAASRALERAPDSVETLALLLAQDRIDDAIGVARRILKAHPDRLLPALRVIARENYRFRDKPRGHPEALQEIALGARGRLETLPREEAARLARQIVMIERRQPIVRGANPFDEMLDEFLRDYAGTEEALLTQVDRMMRSRPSLDQIDTLLAFARAHPGTVPGAKALYQAGFQLGVNIPVTGVERRGSDPTERFMRVLAIARELEGGAYPRNEWVDRAPELITGFFASNPVITPANVDRLEAEYLAFARSHLDVADPNPAESRIAYLLTNKLAELYKTQGDPVPRIERTLDRLAEETGRADVRYMKIRFYLYTAVNEPGQRAAMRAKAAVALRQLSESGTDLYQRKALATLGCLTFEDRDYRGALEHFTRYAQQYPSSPYAWVAALRIGASQDALSDWRSAAASYRAAADTYDAVPMARTLGHEYAARSLEARGDFGAALKEHEAALRAWDPDYGREQSLPARHAAGEARTLTFETRAPISRDALTARIARLGASLAHPSGTMLERGRWLLEQELRTEAVETFARLLRQFPRSPFVAEARALAHHAQLETALTIANVEAPSPEPAAALAMLATLVREPYDEAVCIAGLARATLLSRDRPDEARAAMQETLATCRTQGVRSDRRPPASLEAAAVAVRNAVFQPSGGGLYTPGGWNAFSWPAALPLYLLVRDTVPVKTADGTETQVVLRDPFPGLDNVVFMTGDQIHLLTGVITALGGTKRFVPASVMATPNQPAGAALDVLAFWKAFFPVRPGHWGGWEFESYPRIGSIEFLDAARTRAAVPVTIGYSGATVVLEKRDGVWHMVELTNHWIT